jgi:hypothetical protein
VRRSVKIGWEKVVNGKIVSGTAPSEGRQDASDTAGRRAALRS